MIKYLFKRDTLLASLIVFIVIALLALIPINIHIPNPTKPALQDFNSNKLTYSKLNKNSNNAVDACLTIINIGITVHAEIAAMIEKAIAENPAVAAVAFTEKYKQLI